MSTFLEGPFEFISKKLHPLITVHNSPAIWKIYKSVHTNLPTETVFSTLERCLKNRTLGTVKRESNVVTVSDAQFFPGTDPKQAGLFNVSGHVVVTSPQSGSLELNGDARWTFRQGSLFWLIAICVGLTTLCTAGLLAIVWVIVWLLILQSIPKPGLSFQAALDDFEKQLSALEVGS